MTAFSRALAFISDPEIEGGFVHRSRADDPGGRTYRGISERAHPEAWANGQPSDAMVDDIYRREYWEPIRGDLLPEPVALALFDYAVNSGTPRAVRDLQGLVDADVDGEIGPQTMDLVRAACALRMGAELLALRLIARRHSFQRLLRNYDANRNGWAKRNVLLARACISGGAST